MSPFSKMQPSGLTKISFLMLTLLLQINYVLSLNYTSGSLYPREISASHAIGQQFYDCSDADIEMIKVAHDEAHFMIRKALRKLNLLIDGIFAREPGPDDTITGEQRSVLRTFESIYGHVYFGRDDERNHEGLERVDTIKRLAQALVERFESTGMNDMEIWCSDAWLQPVPDGIETPSEPDNGKGNLWDSRPEERGGQTTIKARTCDNNPGIVASTISFITPGGLLTLMRFCPQYLDEWSPQPIDELQAYSATSLSKLTDKHMGSVYVHELTHAKFLVRSLRTRDKVVIIDGKPKTAYGWARVKALGENNPADALKNADSFRLFVAAMYFDKATWWRNVRDPLPRDRVGWVGEMPREYVTESDSAA